MIYKLGQIQTSQTGGQPYSDTSPYEVIKWVFSGYINRTLKPKVIDIFVYKLEPADFRFRLMERDAGRRREGRRLRTRAENGSKQFSKWAVVAAQLAVWSLPKPVICGSNLVIGKIYIYYQLYWKGENKEKEVVNGPLKTFW